MVEHSAESRGRVRKKSWRLQAAEQSAVPNPLAVQTPAETQNREIMRPRRGGATRHNPTRGAHSPSMPLAVKFADELLQTVPSMDSDDEIEIVDHLNDSSSSGREHLLSSSVDILAGLPDLTLSSDGFTPEDIPLLVDPKDAFIEKPDLFSSSHPLPLSMSPPSVSFFPSLSTSPTPASAVVRMSRRGFEAEPDLKRRRTFNDVERLDTQSQILRLPSDGLRAVFDVVQQHPSLINSAASKDELEFDMLQCSDVLISSVRSVCQQFLLY